MSTYGFSAGGFVDSNCCVKEFHMSAEDILARQKEFLFPCVANYYEEPVVITKAKGTYVEDVRGTKYLDFFGGILTVSLGHCQDQVVEAVQKQMAELGHTSTLYATQNQVDVAEIMAKISPGDLKKSFFTSSGTEADETALLLAKIHTGQTEIIALRHCYSGRSLMAINLTAHSNWRLQGSQVPGIKHGMSPNCYRCPMGLEYPSCGIRCATDLEELIQTETNGSPAAFIAEPIQGVGGFITPPKEYFEVAVGIIRKYGALFVCDEVQTGFGRTGDKWFGIEHWGIEPDIMTMAKGIANGMPVGATIAKEEIANSFTGLSLATYGGNPVSMAATKATLETMDDENVPERAGRLGRILRERLEEFKDKYEAIGDVRGMGLMQAIEFVKDRKSKEPDPAMTVRFMEAAKKHQLLIGKGGRWGNVLRIAPPMLISETELKDGIEIIDKALAEVCGN